MHFHLPKKVKDFARLDHILLILLEEGFGFLVDRMRLNHRVSLKHRLKSKIAGKNRISPEIRLRRTLERLGPTFIKFGQLLSVRPDLVPKSYVKELEKLQDRVPPFPFSQARKIVEQELKNPLARVFSEFHPKPIASASISQVHKAKLKNGPWVAVKVQRPKVRDIMERDITIMFHLARLLEKHVPEIRKYKPIGIVNEFAEWTRKELDFKREANNAKRFYANFKGSKTVKIPKVYDAYTTSSVLVLEYIDAVEISNVADIRKRGLNLHKIVQNGLDAVLTQVFVHGFFHADPHPGNILVVSNNVVSFVDFGIVGYFSDALKEKAVELFIGIIEQDAEKIAEVFMDLHMVEDNVDMEAFKQKVTSVIAPLQGSSIKDTKISYILEDVLDTALEFNIKMPLEFVLFGKTLITLEGIALEYDPEFKLVENVKPFVQKLIQHKTSPRYIAKSALSNFFKYKRFLTTLPEETEKVFRKIQKGTLKVDIEDTDIKTLSLEIDRSSNRLAYGIIIAASIVSGALLMQTTGGKGDVPLLSGLFFSVALLLVIMLFVSIIKEKKVR